MLCKRRLNRFLKTLLEGGVYTVMNDISSETALEWNNKIREKWQKDLKIVNNKSI